ncbi:MAG: flavin reductase [Flavobacteriales bacterium]|nr:flavin reductase family protein [Flavobacteriaceae bacterium]PHX92673.1 MAG: flavin reductase [Flavobacteriales bacterium]
MNQQHIVIDPENTPLRQLHQYLLGSVGPRPICFASTMDLDGRPNLAPFSFFNVVSVHPPVVVFSPNNSGRDGIPKQTFLNAKALREVVVNVVTLDMVEQMNVTAAPWEHGVSEFEKAGFTGIPSDLVRPLRVAESPVQMECKVIDIKEFGDVGGSGKLIMAQVLRIHIKREVLGEDGIIDPFKMSLVGRMVGSWYCKTGPENMFQLEQPMTKTLGYDALPNDVIQSKVLSANDLGKLAGLLEMPSKEELEEAKTILVEGTKHTMAKNLIANGEIRKAAALLFL